MSLRWKVWIVASVVAIFGAVYFVNEVLHLRKIDLFLQETPLVMIEDLKIEEYVSNIVYVKEDDCLHYKFELKEEFKNFSTFEQFSFFHLFSKQLRYRMMNTDGMEQLLHKDFNITAVLNDGVFEFEVIVSEGSTNLLKTNDTLKFNNEIVYTKTEYLDEVAKRREQTEIEYFNGYSDLEIMQFAVRMFNLITVDGKDVKELRDVPRLVTEAVIEEYGIAYEQYIHIFKKYYLLLHTS